MSRDQNENSRHFARALLSISASVSLAIATAHAADPHHHGRVSASVVIEGSDLTVMLEGPAVNFWGFEHEPGNDQEREVVKATASSFGKTPLLLPGSAADCKRIDDGAPGNAHHHDHDDHDKGHDSHDDDHDHEDTHMSVKFQWQWHCEHPDAIESLVIEQSDRLLNVEAMDVTLISDTHQGYAREAYPQTTIKLPLE